MAEFLSAVPLLADVVITKDDMILNGKILEDKKPQYVRFANYHGDFTIKYKQIKEIHRTESYEEDIEILQKMGKSLNEDDIKNNYRSGMKKLGKYGEEEISVSESEELSRESVFMINLFTGKNYGRIGSVLPSSRGISLSAEIPIMYSGIFKQLNYNGIACETDYFYSEKDEKYIKGYSASAGPYWIMPVTLLGYGFNFKIITAAGAGWYSVKNASREAEGIKWDIVLRAGPSFDFDPVVISAQLLFEHIYDSVAPLNCAGISLGAGCKF